LTVRLLTPDSELIPVHIGRRGIRAVHCIERRGVLIPVFSLVTPAIARLQQESHFRELANKIAGTEGVCRH
jgi:hypothetical protein